MGVLGGYWGFLTGVLENRVIFDVINDLVWPPGTYPEIFMLISLLEVCQEWGFKNGGTWRTLRVPDWKAWRTGSSLISWMILFAPRKIPWKFCVDIYIRSVSRMGVLGGRWGFLTGDLEDRVIFDVKDVLGRPQGSYPESFVSLSLFLAEI